MLNKTLDVEDPAAKANQALLSRKGWLVASWAGLAPAPGPGFGPREFEALTICANLESFGARVDEPTARALSWQEPATLSALYAQAESAMRQASGAHRSFEPMYPNFPRQVIEADEGALLRNAMAHYGSVAAGLRELPAYLPVAREAEKLASKGLQFQIVDEAQALSALTAWARSNSAMSPADREACEAIALALAARGRAPDAAQALSGGSNKENLAACAAIARKLGALDDFCSKLAVATDALRVAAALSGGDASLADPTRFGKLSRPERRALLGVVERHLSQGDARQAMENLFERRGAWLRLGERLHPGEMRKAFPLSGVAFDDLRAGKAPRAWADEVKEAYASGDAATVIKILRSRPGEFCRRAAAASRALPAASHDALARSFDGCASHVATPALLQALSAFEEAAAGPRAARAFMPKGGMGKVFLREAAAGEADMDPAFAAAMAGSCERALLERFAAFEPLGRVFVHPALDKVNAPFAARSASRQTRCLPRGSRAPIEGKIARLFLWWGEKEIDASGQPTGNSCGRIDVDLSCLFLGADFGPVGHVSWTMLRDGGGAVVHSGDVTSAPNGACEFIDVDFDKLDPKIKYVAMTVHSFTKQGFDEMPECFAGWMGREAGMKGKLFDGRSVQGKSDLAVKSTAALPIILDVDAREAIWADLALAKSSGYSTVERQSLTISKVARALAGMSKPKMGRLARLHAQARGSLAASPEEADVVFSLAQGVTPYDFEVVASELLANEPPANPILGLRPAAERAASKAADSEPPSPAQAAAPSPRPPAP